MPLTTRQSEILRFLWSYTLEQGWPPTIREIATHFGIRSPNGVVCHLKALEAKGHIKRSDNISRGIRLCVS